MLQFSSFPIISSGFVYLFILLAYPSWLLMNLMLEIDAVTSWNAYLRNSACGCFLFFFCFFFFPNELFLIYSTWSFALRKTLGWGRGNGKKQNNEPENVMMIFSSFLNGCQRPEVCWITFTVGCPLVATHICCNK